MIEMRDLLGMTAVTLAILLTPASSLHAQAPDLSGLDFLLGDWDGSGELFGQEATFSMSWTKTLGGQFLRLRFRNALGSGQAAQPILESEALYQPGETEGWTGAWFDTRGKELALSGQVIEGGRAFRVHWVDPGVEEGVTVYRGLAGGLVEVIDSVAGGSGMRPFGRASYRPAGRD